MKRHSVLGENSKLRPVAGVGSPVDAIEHPARFSQLSTHLIASVNCVLSSSVPPTMVGGVGGGGVVGVGPGPGSDQAFALRAWL